MLCPSEWPVPPVRTKHVGCSRGFTLVELLVVVSIIALLVAILLPSLTKARKQAMTVVCLSNARSIGTGVSTYSAEYNGSLPGPLHPAVYRNLGLTNAKALVSTYERERQLVWKLRAVMGDKSTLVGGITDKVSICPVMDQIVPEKWFAEFIRIKPDRAGLHPTHYVLNNWGQLSSDPSGAPDPTNSYPRYTKPAYYFGLSWPPPGDKTKDTAPVKVEAIKRPSEEWSIAEAWFRPRQNAAKMPRQEGPYQSAWSGEAMPNFAPHMRKGASSYEFSDTNARVQQSARIRSTRADGLTDALYFDNHAASVASQRGVINGFEIFYGFPGTVNADPAYENQW